MATKDIADKKITLSLSTVVISVSTIISSVLMGVGWFYKLSEPVVILRSEFRDFIDSTNMQNLRRDRDIEKRFLIFENIQIKIGEQGEVNHLIINKVLDIQNEMQKLENERIYNKK